MKRTFKDENYVDAEDFINEMVFGGDDPKVVGELVEVWDDEDAYNKSYSDPDNPRLWGRLYAIWGTEEEVDATIEALGEFISAKGRTGRMDEEQS